MHCKLRDLINLLQLVLALMSSFVLFVIYGNNKSIVSLFVFAIAMGYYLPLRAVK